MVSPEALSPWLGCNRPPHLWNLMWAPHLISSKNILHGLRRTPESSPRRLVPKHPSFTNCILTVSANFHPKPGAILSKFRIGPSKAFFVVVFFFTLQRKCKRSSTVDVSKNAIRVTHKLLSKFDNLVKMAKK